MLLLLVNFLYTLANVRPISGDNRQCGRRTCGVCNERTSPTTTNQPTTVIKYRRTISAIFGRRKSENNPRDGIVAHERDPRTQSLIKHPHRVRAERMRGRMANVVVCVPITRHLDHASRGCQLLKRGLLS